MKTSHLPARAPRRRRALSLGAVLAVAAAMTATGASAAAATSGSSTGRVDTATKAFPMKGLTTLGATPTSEQVRLQVTLAPHNTAALGSLIRAEYTPGSASYQHYLTPAGFLAGYAPTAAQVSAVESFLTGAGFTAVSASANRLEVSATGTVAQAEAAFDTSLENVSYRGQTVHANTTPASVPAALGGVVSAVLGLSNVNMTLPIKTSGTPVLVTGFAVPLFQKIYDATGTPTAAKTSIAVMAEGNLTQVVKDLRQEETQNKLPQVPVTIVKTGPASSDTSGADEWDLDTQISTGMADQVKQLYIYDATSLTDADISHEINTFVAQDKANAGSASLGEPDLLPYLDGAMLSIDTSLEEGVAQGQSFFASTGDTGASCAVADTNGVPDSGLTAQLCYPADGTWTTAVGGTTLLADSSGNYINELAWNAGGGGISDLEYPGYWTADSNPVDAAGARVDPDIAMDADLTTGANIDVDGSYETIGGTSVSSPLAMGAWARVLSDHSNKLGDSSLNFYKLYDAVNPSLGDTAAVPGFHDIIAGSNGLFSATPGYDLTTGIGSLMVAALDKAL